MFSALEYKMRLEIKDVRECKNKAYGNFLLRGHSSAVITISLKLNPTIGEYGATLLHELLHAYTTMMRKKGFRVSDRREHQWIYAAEDAIIRTMTKYLKKRK